jgi:hypothetical protein
LWKLWFRIKGWSFTPASQAIDRYWHATHKGDARHRSAPTLTDLLNLLKDIKT